MMRKLRVLSTGFILLAAVMIPAAGLHAFQKPESFRVKLLVPEGEKVKEKDVSVIFEHNRMLVRSRETGLDLKNFSYESIKGAEYSYSTHPLWKSGSNPMAKLALPVFFMKGKKHWLSIKAGGDFGVLRLDKGNFKVVIAALEAHSRLKVENIGEEK